MFLRFYTLSTNDQIIVMSEEKLPVIMLCWRAALLVRTHKSNKQELVIEHSGCSFRNEYEDSVRVQRHDE